MRACKLPMIALIVVLVFLTICVSLSTNIWLSKWTDRAKIKTAENNTSSLWISQIHDMSVYSALGIAQGNKIYFDDLFSIFPHYLRFSDICYTADSKACCLHCWPTFTPDYPQWNTSCTCVFL